MADEHAAAPQPNIVTVVSESRNLRSQPFQPGEDQIATGKVWEEWLEGIEREFRYFKITEAQDKKDALIIYGGKEIARLEKSLPNPTTEDLSEYDKLKVKLNDYYTPKKNRHYARYLFLKMSPSSGETTLAYAARVREKANECEFGENRDDRILEHLVQTVCNKNLIQKAINKKWNLHQFLTEAAQMEDTSLQVKDMKSREDLAVAKVGKYQRKTPRNPKMKQSTENKSSCGYCGRAVVHKDKTECAAFGKNCRRCQGLNHFASVCRANLAGESKPKQNLTTERKQQKQWNRKVKRAANDGDSTSSDDEFFSQAADHVTQVRKITDKENSKKTVTVRIEDVDVQVEPDSGADVNLMDEHQFKALKHRSTTDIHLRESKVKLSTLQNKLPVKGEFNTVIRNITCGTRTRFIVVRGRIQSPPLLGKKSLEELGMIKIQPDGSLRDTNELRIKDGETTRIKAIKLNTIFQQQVKDIIGMHQQVFMGIGKIRDIKNNKDLFAKFSMKPEAVPIAQKPRSVAYHLQKPLKDWLEQGVKEDIFERVPEGEAVTWCSPLVVQPKPRFSSVEKDQLGSHMIRASVDLRVPNQYMERTRITQGPVVEDFIYKFHDCAIFSKLDMTQGYHQLVLDPESRSIATFSTPWGNMRPKRLVFGAKASQDLFDETMYKIFGDIPRSLSQRDDILIGGRSIEEHNETLNMVLQRAEDYGVTFNRTKCQFGMEELEFYGHIFSKDGLKPSPEKVRAIKEAKPPESKEAVRSFLGMTGYLSKFIPKYSLLTAPLRELTHKDVHFKWGPREKQSFEKLKESITGEDTMVYFSPARSTVVRVEASFHEGLAAGLFQETGKGLQPVHFISRSMTKTETRYSQTEKDALAIIWAKNKFSKYLLGAPKFKIITAHKPLIPLFNKAQALLGIFGHKCTRLLSSVTLGV